MLSSTILSTLEDVRALAPQWNALGPLTPFSSWDFAYDWLFCTPEARPFVIAVHDQEQLVGIAPWCLARDYAGSMVLTGIGRESSWYHDPLVHPAADAAEVHLTICQALRPRRWDAIDLILQANESLPLVRNLEQLGLAVSRRPSDRQSRLYELDPGGQAFWEGFSASSRKSMRRRLRQLEAVPHEFRLAQGAQAMEYLEELIQLNRERWQTGENWEPTYAFMRANTPTLLAQGDLRFFVLTIEGRTAALDYQVRKGSRSFAIMASVHPEFADHSPGSLLLNWAIGELAREGIRTLDLGPGEYEWKKRLQSGLVETVRTQVGSSLLGMALVGWRSMIKPRLVTAT